MMSLYFITTFHASYLLCHSVNFINPHILSCRCFCIPLYIASKGNSIAM